MSAMFKAVVFKELRENLKWAVIVLLAMSGMFIFSIPSLEELYRGQGLNLNGILKIANNLDGITTTGGLLAGLLLGVAQIVVENRGDKWGFLAHRPMDRTRLFLGKATAGILLYATATGLPLAVTLFWISSPGYLPIPFDWRIALPAIANLFCGIVFYFAGLLTGMRDARWYVSRGLGIGTALFCIVLQSVAAETFWQAIAMSATALIIVGTAAWGTFVAGGQYGAQPRIGRIATALTIGTGITLVVWLVAAMNMDRFNVAPPRPGARVTFYSVTTDGVFVKVTSEDTRIVDISDPNGGSTLEQYRGSIGGKLPREGILTASLSPAPQAPPSFRSINGLFSQLRRPNLANPVSWYYMHRLRLIAAYDNDARKLIGWMGADGFSPDKARVRPFAGRMKSATSIYDDQHLLVLDDEIYRMDLDNRSIEKIFQREAGEELLGAVASRRNESTRTVFKETDTFEVISTSRRVIVQRLDGTRILEAPQDVTATEHANLQIIRPLLAPGTPTFLRYSYFALPGKESQVSRFDNAGVLVNSWTLPAENSWLPTSRTRVAFLAAMTPPIGQAALEITRQPMQLVPSLFRPPEPPLSGRLDSVRWSVTILSSLIGVAAVFLHGRRYAFAPGRLGTWMGIALLLGPLGYLLMLTLLERPALEPCPTCSRKRIVTREHCEHCGKPFAAPPQDGTEIFQLAD